MPKKHKRNTAKNPKQIHLVKLKAWFARRTSGEWIIAVVLLLGLMAIAKYPISVLQEKLMYSAAEKETDLFASQASAISPSKTEKYSGCSRSSSKFDDGILGCRVGEKITYENVWQTLKQPISHLQDTSFNQYSLQLNIYQYIMTNQNYFAHDTKFERYLLHITPDKYDIIEVPERQNEVISMIGAFL
ncbi:hypothetical protein KBD87_04880 [Candidatus Saccharibacteria bacterium]|nr:hypothetical protein [Candidatus Saccharibacteria bacterium]